ncbi:hypothetical protein CAEBREN_20204 [Caenorhabditis brenneri]|uniref:Uncharacterized protein n=1 Tax=Caenorhabditis brenneri TaxID=135651 RepID=G0NNM9_CAEBE|nr:hypothetical protein CAEBREN_20204 [Caenorhabditis brenneri]
MNSLHNSTRFIGTLYGTRFHQATDIAGKDIVGVENVETSPSLQKTEHQLLLALPFNFGPLKNDCGTSGHSSSETPDKPSLPDTSDIENIRWNWCSRDVDSSLFNLSDHHDLLELYGLNKQNNASIPSLPDTSQIETIRWNWSIREVNSSAFDLDDHEDLLELYGFSEQDVPANDEIFCDPPTWPAKQ